MSKPGESYNTIKALMRTFDLLLFKGPDIISGAISKIQKLDIGTRAPDFTHVGCVILGSDLMPLARVEEQNWLKPDSIYVFESTMSGKLTDGVTDVTDHARFGVQLRPLDEVVELYDAPERSRLAWAPLKKEIRDKVDSKLARFEYEKYKGLRYDASAVDLAAAVNFCGARCLRDCFLFQKLRDFCCCCCSEKRFDYSPASDKRDNDPSKWQFCSELVANIYKDIGIFPENIKADNVIPCDFICDPDNPGSTFDADKQVPMVCMPYVRYHR